MNKFKIVSFLNLNFIIFQIIKKICLPQQDMTIHFFKNSYYSQLHGVQMFLKSELIGSIHFSVKILFTIHNNIRIIFECVT